MHAHTGSSSTRSGISPRPITTSSSSSYPRRPPKRPYPSYINTSYAYSPLAQREPSPPASTYFANFPTDPDSHADPIPLANAQEHFAYSTTLRRHHVEDPLTTPIRRGGFADGFNAFSYRLRRLWGQWKSGERELGLENGSGGRDPLQPPEPPKEGVSVIFASRSVEDTIAHFNTSGTEGLPSAAVLTLREQYGYNEFDVEAPESLVIKFIKTIYESPLNLLLLGSAFISLVMGNMDDAASITLAILIVLTVGFVQERRSEKSLEALNKLVPHHCHLVRDGKPQRTLANDLLPGDLVTFSVGDRIPADVRLISATSLETDESSLTGETVPASKDVQPCVNPIAPLAERSCIAFMGTLVRNGHGAGIVVATGTQTEFGVIFSMMQDVEEKRTPLQLSMDELAKKLSFISFGVIGVICLIGIIQNRGWLEMFTIGVSLAVAAIPEGLPIVTTVTLALGVLRMSKKKAIIKKLPSVEALGCVNVICSDKTGTLTKNEQTVTELYTVDELKVIGAGVAQHGRIPDAIRKTLIVGNICNNAFRNNEGINVGQSTDVALLNVLDVYGLQDVRPSFNKASEYPFSSEHKYMAVTGVHPSDARSIIYIKGSIEAVLDRCQFYFVSENSTPGLDATTRSMILERAASVASRGLRVLAMAYGYGNFDATHPPNSHNLIFTGFQAMYDPPRPGVKEAIAKLHAGGVKVIMITGDAEHTALAIAKELGLKVTGGRGSCLTGAEMDTMTEREVGDRIARGVSVFARVTPRHKMVIVGALQSRGDVVGMTGDGVNDAPALKMADIGTSMGKSGTDVAKEAADVILVDDNFATLLSAVEEGKSIFHNIQNFLSFQLSTAVAALTLITLSMVFHLENPLNAMQILFINILMDGPPSQSLGVDPADPNVMRKPPRHKDASILSPRIMGRVAFSASMIVLGTLFVYIYELSDGSMLGRDQTMTFTCFVFLDLASALQNRGLGCGLFQNGMLLLTVSISFLVQLALIYVPFMQAIFQTEALRVTDLSILLCLAGISMALHEGRRRWERKVFGVGDIAEMA